jgi:hypothetical protein
MSPSVLSRPACLALLVSAGFVAGCGALLGIHDSEAGTPSDDAGPDAKEDSGSSSPVDSDRLDASEAGLDDSASVDADVIDAEGRLSDAADPDLWATPTPTMIMYISDVTGDGKADLIGVEPNDVVVWPSDGTRFVPGSTPWLSQTLVGQIRSAGQQTVFFVDVSGDGVADAVVDGDDAISVAVSHKNGFGALTPWSTFPFSPDLLLAFADTNGDGTADAIGVDFDGIWVALSSGTAFPSPSETMWLTTLFFGGCSPGDAFADVTGSGRNDLIGLNGEILVEPSMGSAFDLDGGSAWAGDSCGLKGNFFADVNGDGKADAIAVSTSGIQVLLSTGTSFEVGPSGADWTTVPFYGAVATFFADVNGDKRADAIAVDNGSVLVWLSNGSSFVSAAGDD